MSQSSAVRVPEAPARPIPGSRRLSARRPARPTLTLVAPPPRTLGTFPFALLCSFVLAAGLLLVLLLNMSLTQGAYEIHKLERAGGLAADQASQIQEELAVTGSTRQLAERATKLGMVPASSSMFLSLPDGRVLGVAPQGGATQSLTVVPDRPTPSGSATTRRSDAAPSNGQSAPATTGAAQAQPRAQAQPQVPAPAPAGERQGTEGQVRSQNQAP